MDKKEAGLADATLALRRANSALDAGDADEANKLARNVLQEAEATGDVNVQARALAFLAHSDRLTSRFRRALDASQQAAFLFRLCGDAPGEVGALATQCYVASSLGRNEEAVEAGLLGVRLGAEMGLGVQRAISFNNLGVAYFWSRDFENARVAFEQAVDLAIASGSPALAWHPRLNVVTAESLRFVMERYYTGKLPSKAPILKAMAACTLSIEDETFVALAEGMKVSIKSVHMLFTGLCQCWSGDLEGAIDRVESGLAWANKYPTTTWLHAVERWVRAEIAWAQSDIPQALRFALQLNEVATRHEHEQLACVAHIMVAQLYELQGRSGDALSELRTLRRREEQIRTESLQSRSRVVAWQLDIRNHERSLRTLESSSRQFERLSNEDPLTGLANRRLFEMRARELLASCSLSGQPLCMILLDVDRFKQVNDNHSHSTGDAVLKVIASLLRQVVREQDLPARLAGDEFVVVLPNADLPVAAQVCERIRASVCQFEWASVASDLQVTVSTGQAQADTGEDLEKLLHRSDVAMYESKRMSTVKGTDSGSGALEALLASATGTQITMTGLTASLVAPPDTLATSVHDSGGGKSVAAPLEGGEGGRASRGHRPQRARRPQACRGCDAC